MRENARRINYHAAYNVDNENRELSDMVVAYEVDLLAHPLRQIR